MNSIYSAVSWPAGLLLLFLWREVVGSDVVCSGDGNIASILIWSRRVLFCAIYFLPATDLIECVATSLAIVRNFKMIYA